MVYSYLKQIIKDKGAGFLLVLDPEKTSLKKAKGLVAIAGEKGVDAILVGGSTYKGKNLEGYITGLKENSKIPIILFPGSHQQVARNADAILFLSLLSGRNPHYLIEEQVKGSPLVKKYRVEPIPCGYILVNGGCDTSVVNKSKTTPIPRDRIDSVKQHALAAQYLGMKLVYLEAGSGARIPIPDEMIGSVKSYVDIPLIVGGGIREPSVAETKVKSGADFVVIGNLFESCKDVGEKMEKFAEGIHKKR